jgi:hypothetical protein
MTAQGSHSDNLQPDPVSVNLHDIAPSEHGDQLAVVHDEMEASTLKTSLRTEQPTRSVSLDPLLDLVLPWRVCRAPKLPEEWLVGRLVSPVGQPAKSTSSPNSRVRSSALSKTGSTGVLPSSLRVGREAEHFIPTPAPNTARSSALSAPPARAGIVGGAEGKMTRQSRLLHASDAEVLTGDPALAMMDKAEWFGSLATRAAERAGRGWR